MEDKILNLTQKIEKKRQKRKIWKNIFTSLAVIVVFCTTYALILPAITKSRTSYCGFESHAHEEACYENQLICTLEEDVPIADPDVEYHSHDEACYKTKTDLVCTIDSKEAHLHSNECKKIESVKICDLEENEEHAHTEECFTEQESIICGKEEVAEAHIHEEECYHTENSLICEKEEIVLPEGHVHEDGCYEQKLICEKEEHEHELMCYSNRKADLETKADWEATVPKELTGVWADDLLAVAKSQLGYKESIANYIVADDDETKGYTRYGDWYGDAYGDWCAMFISFCMNYAQIPENALGYEANCQNWVEKLQERDEKAELAAAMVENTTMEESTDTESAVPHTFYQYGGTYIPKPGDIVFFEVSRENWANHVGIVSEVILTEEDSEEESLGQIKTIEGNASDAVSERTYKLEDTSILGYGALPENPDMIPPIIDGENTSAGLPEDSTVTETPVQEEILITRQTITAAIYTDETLTQIAEDDKTVITITGLLPEAVTAKAYPVVMENTVVDGKNVVFAYDITLYDKDGVLIENQESEYPITVTIEPAEWGEGSEDTKPEDYQIYYIPEEGEPEPMETEGSEDAVSFTTDHFSVYALAVRGTLQTVYLNGASGNDNNSGTASNAAVKTFENALSLVAKNGTIYITGTVTINNVQEWDLQDQNITLKRGSSFLTGPLITVANGGSLTLANISIHGGCETPSSENIDTNTSYAKYSGSRDSYVSAPLIVVNSGGSLVISDGAVLERNSNMPSSISTSGYKGQGGAVYCQGNLTMTGGTVQYCEALSGGGIYIESAGKNEITFNLSGGTIKYNYAREILSTSNGNRKKTYHKNAGGGIYVGDYVTMNMSGGEISYNQTSREGGGISLGWLNRSKGANIESYITTFNMTGGEFTNNTATSTGGGLNITAGRQAFIYAGDFTYNTANGVEYQPSTSFTGNTSSVYSGGAIYLDDKQISSGTTKSGKPGYAEIHRVLITRNYAESSGGGIATCKTSTGAVNASVVLDGTLIYGNTADGKGKDMYLDLSNGFKISGETMLGGGEYNWTETPPYYTNNVTSTSKEVTDGEPFATVRITDNTAGLHGGGIGCNGDIKIGGTPQTESVAITKIWNDDGTIKHPEYIEVQILQNGKLYKTVRLTPKKDANGNETWPTYYEDGLPAGHEYTIKEVSVPGYDTVITPNGNSFTITNTAKTTEISVEKQWDEGIKDNEKVSISVNLLANGDIVDTKTLSKENSWYYKWTNLMLTNSSGEDLTYTVEEVPVEGFEASIEETEITIPGQTITQWQPVSLNEIGTKEFLLISNNGALVRNSSGFKWDTNIPTKLTSNTTFSNDALWVYSNNKLKTKSNYNFYYYSYYSSFMLYKDYSSYITFKDDHICTVVEDYYGRDTYYYFSKINNDGSGAVTSNSSGAISFTPYVLTTTTTESKTTKHFIITNTKNTNVKVNFAKYSTNGTADGNITLLAGAELALYKQSEETNAVVIPGTTVKGILKGEWISETATSETEGIHTIELDAGTYYLIETEVPEGHIGLNGPIIFTIDNSTGVVSITQYRGYDSVTPEVENDGSVNIPIYNTATYQLPETGSFGPTPIVILGLVTFLAVSIFLLYGEEIKMRR